jgi:hypothetical protein
MNAPPYPSYIVATASNRNLGWQCVVCYKMGTQFENEKSTTEKAVM